MRDIESATEEDLDPLREEDRSIMEEGDYEKTRTVLSLWTK